MCVRGNTRCVRGGAVVSRSQTFSSFTLGLETGRKVLSRPHTKKRKGPGYIRETG